MRKIVFYEKPGCINNTKQKKLLGEAGHEVIEKNLLTHPWTAGALKPFFSGHAIGECFNRSNPKVKSGEINPDEIDADTALAMMVEEPLLIRRPLMETGGKYYVGFDSELLEKRIGLAPIDGDVDLESCPRTHSEASCSDK